MPLIKPRKQVCFNSACEDSKCKPVENNQLCMLCLDKNCINEACINANINIEKKKY